MTAEIAILNRNAVALAADSAITISRGDDEKVYNSAHKLFELSVCDPIGIMINNDIDFMETPLQVVIMDYRKRITRDNIRFARVAHAASDFRNHLLDFARRAPRRVKIRHLRGHIRPVIDDLCGIFEKIESLFSISMRQPGLKFTRKSDPAKLFDQLIDHEIGRFENWIAGLAPKQLLDSELPATIQLSQRDLAAIRGLVRQAFVRVPEHSLGVRNGVDVAPQKVAMINHAQMARIFWAVVANIDRVATNAVTTGIVIAGFGQDDLFPTLESFDLCGFIGNCVRFAPTHYVDIDRNGEKAKILPFAQDDMVHRFLYGVDDEVLARIKQALIRALGYQRKLIFDNLSMAKNNKEQFLDAVEEAGEVLSDRIMNGLADEIFDAGANHIESTVVHMPKSELADIAEQLVSFTSIKRRVSSGIETVGGPIDVAVISRSEGFVWVKHKHYFPSGLNPGYLARINRESELV